MKKFFLLLIRSYKIFVSPFLGHHCRYYPTCSDYAYWAIKKHGLLKGFYLGSKRLLRCHPFHEGGFDPVP